MAPGGRRGGKFSKPTRGGGKHFSRNLQPLDKDGNPMGMWRDPAEKEDDETSSEEEDEEESSEEESEEEGNASAKLGNTVTAESDLTREQRKELARQKKAAAVARKNKKVAEVGDMPTSDEEEEDEDEDEDMPANPNHSSKARAQARAATAPSGETPLPSRKDKGQLSRREREAIEAQAAKERYQKLHAEGKTDEARADLERLKLVRQQREEAAARKKAEQEERDAEKKEREAEIEAREKKLREAAMGGTAKRGAKKGKK